MNAQTSVRWIYLAVGESPLFWKQAWLSVSSLLARSGGAARILVYTDRPERYAGLGDAVEVEKLAPAQLSEWIGPEKFFFRAKPCLLRHHFIVHPEDAAVVYLDSDTLCAGDPFQVEESLKNGAFMMHCEEYRVCDNRTKERREYRRRLLDRPLPGGWVLRADSMMWNAGLLGVRRDDAALADGVIEAVDAMDALGLSPRTRLKEQLAFSLAGQATGRLRAAGSTFIHYWGNKAAWERWTDVWLLHVLNRRLDPLGAGRLIADLAPPPAAVAPRKSPAERRKARWRKFLRLD